MDVLITWLVLALLAIPVIAITALVLAIKAGNRNALLSGQLDDLKREVQRLREAVAALRSDSGTGKAPGMRTEPGPAQAPASGTGHSKRDEPRETSHPLAASPRSRGKAETKPVRSGETETLPPPVSETSLPDAEEESPGAFAPVALSTLLRRARFLPPGVGERSEAGLGAWWTTRLGAAMAVIAAVFFGVYVSQDTPPWLRWLALFGTACGVSGLGAWLERKADGIAAFGRVVFAGGLALVYFCAFAAYAIAPVQIADTATMGALLQTVAVVIVLAASLWKQRESIAVMALLLGYVSCGFAFAGDLTDFALLGAATLAAGAAALLLRREWRRPLGVALGGGWIIIGLTVILIWIPGEGEASLRVGLSAIAAGFVFFFLAESLAARGGRGYSGVACPLYHYTNSTAALALGWLFTRILYPEYLDTFYLLFAILLLGVSEEFRRRKTEAPPATGFFVKGSALAALFLVAYFAGEVRWLGILAQAACILAVLKARREPALELVFYAAIGLATGLFLSDVLATGARSELNALLAALFLVALGGILAVRRRFIPGNAGERNLGLALALPAQFATGIAVIAYAQVFFEPTGAVICSLAAAGALGAMEFLAARKHRWFAASGISFIYAQAVFLFGWPGDATTLETLAAGIALMAAGLGGAAAVAAWLTSRNSGKAGGETALHAVWLLTGALILFRTVPESLFFLSTVLSAWAALGTALILRLGLLVLLSALPFFSGLLLALGSWPADSSPVSLWVAASLAAGYLAFLTGGFRPIRTTLAGAGAQKEVSDAAGGLLAVGAFLLAVHETVMPDAAPLVLALGALAMAAACRGRPSVSLGTLSVLVIAFSHAAAYRQFLEFQVSGFSPEFSPALAFILLAALPGTAALGAALIIIPRVPGMNDRQKSFAWNLAGCTSLALIYLGAILPVFQLTAYATALWGGSAVLLFVAGLFFKVKPFRIVALGGLGLCVARLFLHDVQDTFYRIVTFAVLGAVLLGIGFLYHRYRERIEEKT